MNPENLDDENSNSELERVVRKAVDLVTCEYTTCQMYGEYWKCYNMNERNCNNYLNWINEIT